MEAYMTAQERANEKLEAAFEVAVNPQKSFAADNNINLVSNDSDTEDKLEKASEVFKFYNKVYLVFYKPYKQEGYLLEAQNKGDINAMKQTSSAHPCQIKLVTIVSNNFICRVKHFNKII